MLYLKCKCPNFIYYCPNKLEPGEKEYEKEKCYKFNKILFRWK